jgi:very-short-patch-repair endonuclease
MSSRQPLPAELRGRTFLTRDGLAAGLSPTRMRGRDLQRPFRGVRVDAVDALTLRARCEALQQILPPDARYCGITAALLLGVPLPERLERLELARELHVAVPRPRRAPTGRGIRGHSVAASPADAQLWHRLRLSTAVRTWCELGAILTVPDLVAAGDYLIHWDLRLASVEELADALANYSGRRGLPALRAALPLLDERAESPQESRLRVILVRGGLRELSANLPITTSDGFRYRADIAFPASALIIEYQSGFHDDPDSFRKDMTRISRLEADGWRVMQVNADDLRDPRELVARVRRVLARH